MLVTTISSLRPSDDAVLAAAVDVARAAAEEIAAPGHVGEHLGVEGDAERLATHHFRCLDTAYTDWHWAVTVTRVPRGKVVTVCEAVLLPGADSLLSRDWVPWSERLAPGDLGVGDLLPTEADDDRLEPGWAAVGTTAPADDRTPDDDADRVAVWELGLGRERVLSPIGRADALDRWYSSAHGPTAPIAESAPARCASCGFLLLMAGSVRRAFGVCANAYSPSDGQVVSLDHGCGAHSDVAPVPGRVEVTAPLIDDLGYEVVALGVPADLIVADDGEIDLEVTDDEVVDVGPLDDIVDELVDDLSDETSIDADDSTGAT